MFGMNKGKFGTPARFVGYPHGSDKDNFFTSSSCINVF